MRSRLLFVFSFVVITLSDLRAQSPGSTPDITNPTGNAGALKPQIATAGSYDANSGNATRIVNDLHVPGALGVYGLDFTRYWNSTHNDYEDLAMEWPLDFGASGWSHSWHWSAREEFIDPEEPRDTDGDANPALIYRTAINITFPDGHTTQFKIARVKIGHWQVPGSYPWFGPPYTPEEIQNEWPYGGTGVHDHLCNMAPDGTQFWLCRADGGSVHFEGGRATEVFDPHGFKTTLSYDSGGHLTHIEQDGGRYLELTWEYFAGGGT